MNFTDEEIDTTLTALRRYGADVRGMIKNAPRSERAYLSRRALQAELLIQKLEMPQPIELCKLCGGRHHHEEHRS